MAESNKLIEARRILQSYIKLNNLRNTPERKAVLEAVFVVSAPFTVDSVKEYLDNVYPVTRVTVYNNLECFFQAGIIIKRSSSGYRGIEYETSVQTLPHHNLCCTNCQQVFEFKDSSIKRFFEGKKYKKFTMTNCAVMIFGICAKCQSKIAREKRKQFLEAEQKKQLDLKKKAERKHKAELKKIEQKRKVELKKAEQKRKVEEREAELRRAKELRTKERKKKLNKNNKKQ